MNKARRMRITAAVVALALPLGAYVCGDVCDAFPGVLTLERASSALVEGVPVSGEMRETSAPSRPYDVARSAAEQKSVTPAQLTQMMNSAAGRDIVAGRYAYCVVDAKTGEVLVQHDADSSRAPASTMKLLTSLAAVRTLDPDTRFTTSTRLQGSTLALVGGGDMLLTTQPEETKEGVPRASLAKLADQTAADLKKKKTTSVTLVLDDTYFAHDPLNPAWKDNGPQGGWVAPIMSVGIDGGRKDGTAFGAKSTDPGMDATTAFAQLLKARGITVNGNPARAKAGKGTHVASVQSAPLKTLIKHTLLYSDNTVAELIGRHAARESGHPTTVAGARQAVADDLAKLAQAEGFSTEGLRIADNSGLSVDNRVSPSLFAHLTAWASGKAPDDVKEVFAMVPIGGLNGTLTHRFEEKTAVPARGIVRGKTGYLGGVASLAGTTVLADGRTVGYSILVYGFDGARADDARHAVDAIATSMVEAGAAQ